jgi:hypothetical protein
MEGSSPMPDTARQIVKARTESHSDVANSQPARDHQASLTEREFCGTLMRALRENKGEVRLHNLQEEWITAEDGMVHEITVEMVPVE